MDDAVRKIQESVIRGEKIIQILFNIRWVEVISNKALIYNPYKSSLQKEQYIIRKRTALIKQVLR